MHVGSFQFAPVLIEGRSIYAYYRFNADKDLIITHCSREFQANHKQKGNVVRQSE